jgi:predicted PolB exonuclease-like 3'-5' exonuclease
MKGRIVCIGCSYDDDIVTFSGNEFEVLTDFAIHIQNRMDEILSPLVFVGWNIGSFDLPWLWRKAIQHSLPSLRKAIPKDNRTCYIDLMKVWATDFKDYVSLDNCAKFLGIEHDTEGGNKVYDWWKAGEIDKIIEHCRKDIETTKQIYERIYE